jgi:hypothetical protein
MKGVSFIANDKNEVKSVVIDLKTIRKSHEEVHELIDTLVAESRKDDETISWDKAKKQLAEKGKL